MGMYVPDRSITTDIPPMAAVARQRATVSCDGKVGLLKNEEWIQ
jgi:hypothetical protein